MNRTKRQKPTSCDLLSQIPEASNQGRSGEYGCAALRVQTVALPISGTRIDLVLSVKELMKARKENKGSQNMIQVRGTTIKDSYKSPCLSTTMRRGNNERMTAGTT